MTSIFEHHALAITMPLEEKINALFDAENPQRTEDNLQLLADFREALNRGEIRAAEPVHEHWKPNPWVKKGILLHLKLGLLIGVSRNGQGTGFELDTLPYRNFTVDDGVRIPGANSCVRDGTYVAAGVTCMPPVFINMGAYIESGSLLDSHVLVGLCTQVGARVQISSGTQIGGVINPLEGLPTILSDDVIVGGNCGLYDGVFVGRGAVLAAGTILTGQSRIYDLVNAKYYQRTKDQPLTVPPLAVVVPGAKSVTKGPGLQSGLMLHVPVIAAYRDSDQLQEDLLSSLLDGSG